MPFPFSTGVASCVILAPPCTVYFKCLTSCSSLTPCLFYPMAGRQLLLSEKGTTPALNVKLPLTFVFIVGDFGYWYLSQDRCLVYPIVSGVVKVITETMLLCSTNSQLCVSSVVPAETDRECQKLLFITKKYKTGARHQRQACKICTRPY